MNGESMITDINQNKSRLTDFPVNNSKIININQNNSRVTDILVRTWKGDGHWLIFLLRSIEKFVSRDSYRNVIITYDKSDAHFFNSYLPKFKTLPIKTIAASSNKGWKYGHNNGGYHAQIYSKMMAHTYSDADFFVHIDSDCIFNQNINSSHFFDSNGRVYLSPVRFSDLPPNFRIWQNVSQSMLLVPVEFETMTRLPLVYPRVLYPAVLDHISKVHKNKNVLSVLQQLPSICEFTSLGAYLMKFMPELWTLFPKEKEGFVNQGWSWGGFGPENVAYYECILRAQKREDCFFASSLPTPTPTSFFNSFLN